MDARDEKWNHEFTVFRQALSLARAHGGEARRNVDKLTGQYDFERERPDIAIERESGSIVGLEHFRVDRLVHKDKKVRSTAKEYEKDLQDVRKDLLPKIEERNVSDEVLRKFGKEVYKGMRLYTRTGPNDLLRSLQARVDDHSKKLGAYRCELMSDYPYAYSIELGYLIEMHADLSGMFLNENNRVTMVPPGQMPLFDELYDLLESAAQNVDWIVIANYNSIGKSIVDASVIRCKGGSFRTSCKRQGLSRTAILNAITSPDCGDEGRNFTPEFERTGDKIEYKVEKAFQFKNPGRLFKRVIRLTGKAMEYYQAGVPFLASTEVQMTYELVRSEFSRKRVENPARGTLKERWNASPKTSVTPDSEVLEKSGLPMKTTGS